MMRVAEVARRLDVSGKVVYALLESGRLRAYRVGAGRGSYRVTEEQLRDYLSAPDHGVHVTHLTAEQTDADVIVVPAHEKAPATHR